MTRPRVAVIGGGVTGLAAAYELRNDATVTIFEQTDRLGGKVLTDRLDGIQIEAGPDSLLARDDEPIQLLRDLGLAGDVVEPRDFGAWIYQGGRLKRLPEGFVLGVPASPAAIMRSGLLSPKGTLRAAADLVLPRSDLDGDVSVGRFVRARFGDEVADRIVAPLMSGVRSGDIDEMSLDMAAPQVAAVARTNRSVTLGLRRQRRTSSSPRFIGLAHGMSSLVDALADRSGAEVLLRAAVHSLGDDLTIEGRSFDGIVVTAPPTAAARLLELPELAKIRFSGGTVTNLVYESASVSLPPSGTGILVAPGERRALVACTWFTRKWPHLAPADGRLVIRCVGSRDAAEQDVVTELEGLVGATASPRAAQTYRWDAALPVFRVGHRHRLAAAAATLRDRPVRLAGAGYLATGLNDCLAHGRSAAREVLERARP